MNPYNLKSISLLIHYRLILPIVLLLGRVLQSVGHVTRKSEILGSTPGLATYLRNWRKYVQEALVNRLGGLILPRKSVVWLTDRRNLTLDVYHGCKTTTQQQQQFYHFVCLSVYELTVTFKSSV